MQKQSLHSNIWNPRYDKKKPAINQNLNKVNFITKQNKYKRVIVDSQRWTIPLKGQSNEIFDLGFLIILIFLGHWQTC